MSERYDRMATAATARLRSYIDLMSSTSPPSDAKRCRWPMVSPGAANFHHCGRAAISGLPYCGYHSHRAFVERGRATEISP